MRSGDRAYDLLAPASPGVTPMAAWAQGALDPGRFARRSCTLAQSAREKGQIYLPCFLLFSASHGLWFTSQGTSALVLLGCC